MARKSRTQEQLMQLKPSLAETCIENSPVIYKTAIYARLSNNNFASTTVDVLGSQLNHLQEYVASHSDMELVDTYVDDGWSGINFNRPDFSRMMEDMKAGKINCIVVRDFSRFGRNYLETGYYMQKIFPAYNIRFISVFDDFDSLRSDSDSMIVSMMQLVNDFYCKDTSRKICSAYDSKAAKGFSWGSIPYGYKRRNDESGRLLLDEEKAYMVYLIFHWVRNEVPNYKLSHNLNLLGFLPYKDKSNPWSHSTIRSLLRNPLYTGDYVYNRNRNRKYDGTHIGKLPPEQWKYIQRTHPAYITKSEYLLLQEEFTEKAELRRQKVAETALTKDNSYNPFHQLLYCGECGHRMTIIKNDPSYVSGYRCKGHFQIQAVGHLSYTINRTDLMETVRKQLIAEQTEALQLQDRLTSLPISSVIDGLHTRKTEAITRLMSRKSEIDKLQHRAEKDHRQGLLDTETHSLQIEKLDMEKSIIESNMTSLQNQIEELSLCLSAKNPWIHAFISLEISEEIPSTVLNQLIRRIEVSSEHPAVISYHLIEYKQKLLQYMKEWEKIKSEKEEHGNAE